MLLLVYTVVDAQQAGWGSARTIGSFAAVVALGGLFAVIETRSTHPLVPFGIFRSAPLRRAQIGAITLFAAGDGSRMPGGHIGQRRQTSSYARLASCLVRSTISADPH